MVSETGGVARERPGRHEALLTKLNLQSDWENYQELPALGGSRPAWVWADTPGPQEHTVFPDPVLFSS